ncbi:dimethylamine corrinoid protein 3 [Thermacetogenium phaeum DSM 12270]|uniref:Dimethylamine corrinoid protein 3 n=1 Tax=Thermacetogenium phaeum (strain ATCC BAA-254 / DSM 26808 / PB) TaxID=1089553 RepID=K4LIZ1_THEPS|nr:corrinoid protein [Thermacetogenium phaeum]AFV12966.1 dimethylamine corrinoid protein 3 [Thermacetogenium phaeum DSM 12270]
MGASLTTYMGDMLEEEVYAEVKRQLDEGVPPEKIFEELQKGMEIIGERYQAQEYYLSELIMAADIFKKAAEPLQERLKGSTGGTLGTMVLGTVAGDIHDIGKNIVGLVFSSNGFNVIDLGVDVPVQKFVEAVKEHKPQIVGLSCLLTTSFDSLKATVEALEQAGLRDGVKVLIGGGPVDESTCRYAGADAYCVDAPAGVDVAKKMLGVA